mmetsp:Transcript_7081/g.20491  ORF Transcript_7081/g.20491 Transcript_7081/m.20491 type:complete len:265 (+) Transcript_7081:529-1323(+)
MVSSASRSRRTERAESFTFVVTPWRAWSSPASRSSGGRLALDQAPRSEEAPRERIKWCRTARRRSKISLLLMAACMTFSAWTWLDRGTKRDEVGVALSLSAWSCNRVSSARPPSAERGREPSGAAPMLVDAVRGAVRCGASAATPVPSGCCSYPGALPVNIFCMRLRAAARRYLCMRSNLRFSSSETRGRPTAAPNASVDTGTDEELPRSSSTMCRSRDLKAWRDTGVGSAASSISRVTASQSGGRASRRSWDRKSTNVGRRKA